MLINEKSQLLLKELRESWKWCCINISSDYHFGWEVTLYRAFPKNEEHVPTIKSSFCEDLNKAIESVYKKAKKYLEEEK